MNKLLVDLDCDLGRTRHPELSFTEALDREVSLWANEVVPTYGGHLRDYQVDAVNKWMKKIKKS